MNKKINVKEQVKEFLQKNIEHMEQYTKQVEEQIGAMDKEKEKMIEALTQMKLRIEEVKNMLKWIEGK